MNNIVIGKRIPIGAAVSGLITFGAHVWNLTNPDTQLSIAAVGGLATTATVMTQVLVVNCFGVTHAKSDQE